MPYASRYKSDPEARARVLEQQRVYRAKNRDVIREKARLKRLDGTDHAIASNRRWRARNPERALLLSVRARAKKLGLTFALSVCDIVIPTVCPVLGIPIVTATEVRGEGRIPGSPSVDRLIPSLGYVPGNIRVISFRANELKRDASVAEMEAVLAYMKRELKLTVAA